MFQMKSFLDGLTMSVRIRKNVVRTFLIMQTFFKLIYKLTIAQVI